MDKVTLLKFIVKNFFFFNYNFHKEIDNVKLTMLKLTAGIGRIIRFCFSSEHNCRRTGYKVRLANVICKVLKVQSSYELKVKAYVFKTNVLDSCGKVRTTGRG